MKIRDIMSTPAHTIGPEATLMQAWSLMELHRIRHLPVVEAGKVVAILSDDDVKAAMAPGKPSKPASTDGLDVLKVREHATHAAVCIGPDERLPRAANLMRQRRIGCLPVVNGEKLLGIVTATDLLDRMGRHSR